MAHNPVDDVKRLKANNNEGLTPALGAVQARALLNAPRKTRLKGSVTVRSSPPSSTTAFAGKNSASNDLWLQLAARREPEHPDQALPIYQRQIEPLVNQKNQGAYEQAVHFVRKVRDLLRRLGRDAEFAGYLEALRKAHKPKRNFMALLNRLD